MKRRLSKGFTLIELMIVVAIIGILAAIAVPNFMKFQARARQSEAKTNLRAWGTAAKSYFAEYNTWDCKDCGVIIEANNRYSYHAGGSLLKDPDPKVVVTGSTACSATGSVAGSSTVVSTAKASGQIDNDAPCDTWSYDPNSSLMTNDINDVMLDK
jgi:prepilin-type N-terminal cleavage/methylation domain-containing protein